MIGWTVKLVDAGLVVFDSGEQSEALVTRDPEAQRGSEEQTDEAGRAGERR